MSFSEEKLDELLSASMDDALSGSEQAELQQLLASDASLAGRLGEMQELSAAVRLLVAAPQPILGDRFANRVIDQAVTAAIAENLGEDHPVVMLAGQPAQRNPSISPARVAAAVAALAASALLVWFLKPGGDVDSGQQVAASGESTIETSPAPVTSPVKQPVLAIDGSSPAPVTSPLKQPVLAIDGSSSPATPQPFEPSVAPENDLIPTKTNIGGGTLNLGSLDAMVAIGASGESSPAELGGAAVPGIVTIMRITRTPTGRERSAVRRAMERASLSELNQKEVSDEIVSAVVASADQPPQNDSSLIYVEAPVTQFDKLFMVLFDDTQGIESISLGLVQDAPVMQLVGSLQPTDPTTIRHGVSLELTGADGASLDALRDSLNSGTFLPLDRTSAAAGAVTATSGPNENAKMLLLVR